MLCFRPPEFPILDGLLGRVEAIIPVHQTFTVGVTDIIFNPINAIFGRALHTPDKHAVTLAYWQQKEEVSHDEVPYFEK